MFKMITLKDIRDSIINLETYSERLIFLENILYIINTDLQYDICKMLTELSLDNYNNIKYLKGIHITRKLSELTRRQCCIILAMDVYTSENRIIEMLFYISIYGWERFMKRYPSHCSYKYRNDAINKMLS